MSAAPSVKQMWNYRSRTFLWWLATRGPGSQTIMCLTRMQQPNPLPQPLFQAQGYWTLCSPSTAVEAGPLGLSLSLLGPELPQKPGDVTGPGGGGDPAPRQQGPQLSSQEHSAVVACSSSTRVWEEPGRAGSACPPPLRRTRGKAWKQLVTWAGRPLPALAGGAQGWC